jgi:hypothetical protein
MIFVGVAGCRSIKVPSRRKDLGLLKIHVAEPEDTFEVNLTSARQDPGPGGRGPGASHGRSRLLAEVAVRTTLTGELSGGLDGLDGSLSPSPVLAAEILVGRRVAIRIKTAH